MPFVQVVYDPRSAPLAKELGPSLAIAIAAAFSEADPKHRFGPKEATIRFDEKKEIDICNHDIGIVIWANYYEERLNARDKIASDIGSIVKEAIPDATHYVYVRLTESGFYDSKEEEM
jgi:hypothetical protein